ncbi:MAG: HAMP domain-containing protein [Leptothrix sp. (in: Bacteria)]|jgi:two-component system nitrate/nitrite sensor histidine kinase NarX|nr:HAMP domain-containing protein [Leptothrix sp. (in: b-proteobacteria)]HQY08933.1 histidine kinase [Burkholderiaceae bacterium]
MKRLFPALRHGLQDSVLLRTAIAMGVLALLSLGSIVISAVIADDISGRANAVNVSGSLRFLSYRTLSEVLQPERRAQASDTIKVFERRLLGLERFLRSKSRSENPSHSLRAVQTLLQRWNTQVRILELAAARGDPGAVNQLALEIPAFVDQIDQVVHLIEVELEHQASWLRVVQLVLLGCIVVVSLLTIWLLHSQLVQPLAQLLEAARTVSQGSFSARVAHVGEDELGRVGQAFNAMVGEIAAMYTHLADKVEEKTRELQRTNESLELLYRVSQKLSASDLTLDQVQEVLREVEVALELGHSMICVSENNQLPAHTVSGDLSLEERHALCSRRDCGECFLNAQQPLLEQGRTSSALLIVPIGDGDHLRGVLPVLKVQDQGLPLEKARIIETVGHHVSNALINMRRAEEKHRLAVMEERSVIARELHDSIAQSLSYLKIQVTRLEKSLDQGRDPRAITEELKQGLSGAYRELRELIVTFRLRVDERGLNMALHDTVAEFSQKLGFPVRLSNALSGIVLSANEELHLLRIVREALSNIERHAQASAAGVAISMDAFQVVTVRVEDNGRGFDPAHTPRNHFGVNIMNDRAMILAGRLDIESTPGEGTRIRLQFLPQKVRHAVPEIE